MIDTPAGGMSELTLFSDLSALKLITRDGGAFTPPPLVLGDTLVCPLHTMDRVNGVLQERQLNVRSLRASIGRVMEPPTSGTFTLRTRDVTGEPGTVTIGPTTGRWILSVRVFDPEDEGGTIFEFDVVNETTLAAAVAEITAAPETAGKIVAMINGGGAAVLSAVSHGWSITVDYAAFAPDDPGLDGQPVSVTGNATPPTNDPGPDSAPIAWNSSDAEFVTTVSPVLPTSIAEVSAQGNCCWLFRLSDNSRIPLEAGTSNRLDPVSFVRVRWFERFEGEWWCEVRLIQTPVAFSSSFDRVLPPAPTVERVRAGATRIVGSSANTNEIQKLHVPPEFEGTYTAKFDYRTTRLLGNGEAIEDIAAALNGMYPDGKERFKTTNPEPEYIYIEFTGPLAETPQPLITTMVHTFHPGVLTFSIFLGRPEMHALLRDKTEVELVLEVEVEVLDEDEDAADPAIPGRHFTLFQQKVKVVREQIFEELTVIPAIDWATPAQPRNYIPIHPDQVITGQQHYTSVFGDGVRREFSFLFSLGTPWISSVLARENKARGRVLVHGTDYTLEAGDDAANELVFTLSNALPVPAVNELAICITTAGPKSAFQQHGHALEEVDGLTEYFEAYDERLANLENKMPYTVPGVRETSDETEQVFALPPYYAEFPGRFASDNFTTPQEIKRPAALLPAIHDAEPDPITAPLPSPTASRQVDQIGVAELSADAAAGATTVHITTPGALATGQQISFDLETFYTVGVVPLSGTTIPISPALVNDVFQGDAVHRRIQKPYAGDVFLYSGAPLVLPGRKGAVSSGTVIGTDGRAWYPVKRSGESTSYYPADYEHQMFTFPLNDRMLRPGGELKLEFNFAAQLVAATTAAQCVLVVEFGETPQQAAPAPIGVNLQDVTWNPTPLLAQRIILTGQRSDGKFGVAVRRGTDNTFAADRQIYGVWEAAGSVPTSANLVLRARVIQFDTENSVSNARGAVWIGFSDAKATLTNA